MNHFLVAYDPSKGRETALIECFTRWRARRLIRGVWVLQADSTAEITRQALVRAGGSEITCVIVEIRPHGDHAEIGADELGRIVLQAFGDRPTGL